MSEDRRSKQRTFVGIMVVAAIVFILMLVLWFPRDEGGNGNVDGRQGPWNDLDNFKRSVSAVEFFNYYEVNGARELVDITTPKESVYLLVGLERPVNSSELVQMAEYLENGGHIIVADDGTEAQRITDYLFGRAGGKVNFTGHRYLVDRLFSDPEGDRGFVYNVSFIKGDTFNLRGTRYELLLHSPNGMEFTGPGRPLVWTTKQLTVVDLNDNWQMDLEGDKYIQFGDIMVEYDIGTNGGRITYVTTTGLFTDNIFEMYQNEAFIRAYLYSLLPTGGDVVLDTSKQWERFSPHTEILPE